MTRTRIAGLAAGALLALISVAAALLWITQQASAATAHTLRPDDPSVLALGQRIYQANCAACHGAGLQGQANWRDRGPDGLLPAPPHDASGHTWHHPDEQLFAIVKVGIPRLIGNPNYKTSMPAYEGVLSDEEIVAVLSWIKAQWPPEVRRQHDEINAQARKR